MKKVFMMCAVAALMLSACGGNGENAKTDDVNAQVEAAVKQAQENVKNLSIEELTKKVEELKAAGATEEQLSKLQQLIKTAKAAADEKIDDAADVKQNAEQTASDVKEAAKETVANAKEAAEAAKNDVKQAAADAKAAAQETKEALKGLVK